MGYNKIRLNQNSYHNCSKIGTVWFYNAAMHPKDADGMANSADPDQTASSVCSDLSVPAHRVFTVIATKKRQVYIPRVTFEWKNRVVLLWGEWGGGVQDWGEMKGNGKGKSLIS